MKYAADMEEYRKAVEKRGQENCAPLKIEKRCQPVVNDVDNRRNQYLRAMKAFQKHGRPVVVATVVVSRCAVKIERAEDE